MARRGVRVAVVQGDFRVVQRCPDPLNEVFAVTHGVKVPVPCGPGKGESAGAVAGGYARPALSWWAVTTKCSTRRSGTSQISATTVKTATPSSG